MNEMTLPSRHRIQNSIFGGLRPSTLHLGHGGSPLYCIFTSERGKNFFDSLKLEGQSGVRTRNLRLSKQAALSTAPGPPPPDTKRLRVYQRLGIYANCPLPDVTSLGGLKETKNVSAPSTCESQYCGEPP